MLAAPAVVLNPGTAGVGLIHALALGKVPIITVGRRWPPMLGSLSRYPTRRLHFDARRESLTECLLRVAPASEVRPVLYPAIDVDLEALLLDQEKLSARYQVPAAPHIGADIFAKNWQYDLAERVGVPIPLSLRFVAGAVPDLSAFRFPLIIKPSSRTEAVGGRAFRLAVVEDQESLDRLLESLQRDYAGREFQLAENIPGEPANLVTVGSYSDRSGKVLRSFTGRKVSQHPFTHGDASIAESIELPEVVVEQARRLLEGARFHGISQVEFKYDPRDDLYKLLEINGRSWSWIKLPAYSGVNLPLIQHYDLTDDPRLGDELARPQRYDTYFVREQLVALNALAHERRLLTDIAARKRRVSAIHDAGDPLLGATYRAAVVLTTARKAFTE